MNGYNERNYKAPFVIALLPRDQNNWAVRLSPHRRNDIKSKPIFVADKRKKYNNPIPKRKCTIVNIYYDRYSYDSKEVDFVFDSLLIWSERKKSVEFHLLELLKFNSIFLAMFHFIFLRIGKSTSLRKIR